MKRLVLLAALLALSACNVNIHTGDSGVTTVYDKSSDADGVKTHVRMVMSAYSMRAALGDNPNTAAYVTVRNEGDSADRLVSASCDCAAMVMLHTADMSEPAGGFAIAPGESLTFAPGGNHIMLSGLKTRPKAGETQAIVLHFEKAGDLNLVLPVLDAPQGQH